MRVMITQSMLFPWVGLLEQVRLADIVVHYDDVQFSKGSFVNRVQLKTDGGSTWMTIPLANLHLGQTIDDVSVDTKKPWREDHLRLLDRALAETPHHADVKETVTSVYSNGDQRVGPLARRSFMACLAYFGLDRNRRFIHVSDIDVPGSSSDRVLSVVKALGGTDYITGHGARKYLDHESFERAGVSVSYIDYRLTPYPQLNGAFLPYVSSLDLIGNVGRDGINYITSQTVDWREFLERSR